MGLERINELRKQKKISVDELSTLSGVPKGTLSKITAGITKNPNLETVRAIANALDCTLDELSEIEETPKSLDSIASEDELFLFRVGLLQDFFQKSGYIEDNGDISQETKKLFKALIDFLDSYFKE